MILTQFHRCGLIMAATEPDWRSIEMIGASVLLGLAVAWFMRTLGCSMTSGMSSQKLGYYEDQRRGAIRSVDATFRWFEPVIEEVATSFYQDSPAAGKLAARLDADRSGPPWRADELLACWMLQSIALGVGVGLLSYLAMGVLAAALVGLFVGFGYFTLRTIRQGELVTHRLVALKRRLPYAIDLMALMLEAGSTFLDALKTVVIDNRSNPLGEEFGTVLQEIDLGRTRSEALLRLRDRLPDEDVEEIIFAIVKGEELGTPLSQILRSQADQLQLKRSQWAEKAAAEAQVRIVFPGMAIMVACLLIIVAPFLLKLLHIL